MSFLKKMKSGGLKNLPHGTERAGLKGVIVDKGERYGASLAYGYLKGYYREKFMFKGYGLDLWTGVGALVASAAATIMSGGRSSLAPHLERIGDAGVSSYLNTIGSSLGASKAGRSAVVVDQAKLPGKKASVLGMIPQAMGGSYLTQDELAHFAARR